MDFSEQHDKALRQNTDLNQGYEEYEEYAEPKSSRMKSKSKKHTSKLSERFNAQADKLHSKDKNYRFSNGLNFVLYLLLVVIGALAIRQFVFEPTVVEGESMQNTLINGERVIVEKVSYWFSEPKRGDIVIVHFPDRGNVCFVKRVIAFAGETIEIKGKDVYINDEKLDESDYAWFNPKLPPLPLSTKGSVNGRYTVPEGCIFVMGDNRCNSHDSRAADVGPIPLEHVLGKAQVVIWPFDKIRNPYK